MILTVKSPGTKFSPLKLVLASSCTISFKQIQVKIEYDNAFILLMIDSSTSPVKPFLGTYNVARVNSRQHLSLRVL